MPYSNLVFLGAEEKIKENSSLQTKQERGGEK
jgi:hypothetical protein